MSINESLPLQGIRVVEFTHMVMGPTCGMVLADLGAEVIKVEPIEGDRTRHLLGAGAGFLPSPVGAAAGGGGAATANDCPDADFAS